LGDHRFDDRLADLGPAGQREELAWAARRVGQPHAGGNHGIDPTGDVDAVRTDALDTPERVDAALLHNQLLDRTFALEALRETSWDPLVANPGTSIYTLLARDFAPLGDRLRSAAGRLRAVPEHLATARDTLGAMPKVHVETAIGQFTGTRTLLATELERRLGEEPSLRGEVELVRDAAVEAIDEHLDW